MEATQFIVVPIDTEKVSAFLHETLKSDPALVRYNVEKVAWLKNADCMTDNECVYSTISKELQGAEVTYVYDLDVRIDNKSKTGSGWSCGMFPSFHIHLNMDELIEKYALPETDLKTFMGSRYNYNNRIGSNMDNLMKLYSSCIKEEEPA